MRPFSSIELACAVRLPGPCVCVLRAKLLRCCCPRTCSARDPGAMQRQANTFFTLHSSHPALQTSSPKQTPCNIHTAIAKHFAATRTHPCSHYNAICIHTRHQGKTDSARNDPKRTRCAHEVPFIAGRNHFTRKNKRLPAPASSPKQTPCNSDAAIITMRFAATRTHPCSYYIAICIHTLQNTKGEPIALETIQTAPAAHTRYLSPLAPATLHEKRKVACSGFLHKTNPMQQSCSHYSAFCSNTYQSMQLLQCDLHPHVAEHQGRTDYARNDPNRTRRAHKVPFTAGCSHFTRKKKGCVLRLPPQNKPHATVMQQSLQCVLQQHVHIHAAITLRFASTRCRTPRENQLRSKRSKPHPPH